MEPIVENVKTNIDEQKHETVDFTINSFDNVEQQLLSAKEETLNIKDMAIISKPTDRLMEPIVRPPHEKLIPSLEEKDIVKEVANKDQICEVPHIDFICGDKLLILEDCDPLIQRQQLIHLTIRSQANAGFKLQKKPHLHSPSTWMKRLSQASKSCKENGDQVKNQ